MRQPLGEKKIAKLSLKTGLDIKHAMVRGGTDHRIDLFLADKSLMHLYKDGTIETEEARRKRIGKLLAERARLEGWDKQSTPPTEEEAALIERYKKATTLADLAMLDKEYDELRKRESTVNGE